MKKLISSLTALSLMVASSVPMLTNAMASAPNYKGDLTLNDMVSEVFGENHIVEYLPKNYLYFVMSPKNFGSISIFEPELVVNLKSGSEFDEKSLNQLVWKNCTPYVQCYKSDSDENTYVFERHEIYSGNKTTLEEEIYPTVAEFLSKYDDVVSIKKNNVFAVDYDNLVNYSIRVSKDVDFDYDKYSDYIVQNSYEPGYLSVMSPLADYYYDEDDKEFIVGTKPKDGYYEDMYNAYLNLQKDYGEENVVMMYNVLEYGFAPETQSIIENLYTALISGDTNADGEVNISDVLAITAYIANPAENQLNETALINADVNGDGAVNANDALTIQQYLANVITEL